MSFQTSASCPQPTVRKIHARSLSRVYFFASVVDAVAEGADGGDGVDALPEHV
jgi:hypothetical protein